jgi:ubiquinol-cytochrome c reductase cytochrome b subunit
VPGTLLAPDPVEETAALDRAKGNGHGTNGHGNGEVSTGSEAHAGSATHED